MHMNDILAQNHINYMTVLCMNKLQHIKFPHKETSSPEASTENSKAFNQSLRSPT